MVDWHGVHDLPQQPGKAELTAVIPERAEGLRVKNFAVRLNQNWKPTQGHPGVFLGEERAPLEHFGFTSRTVDVACAHGTSKGYELAVRVLKTTAGPRSRLGGSSHTEAPGANGPSPSRSGYSCALLSRLTQGNAKSKARKPRSAA